MWALGSAAVVLGACTDEPTSSQVVGSVNAAVLQEDLRGAIPGEFIVLLTETGSGTARSRAQQLVFGAAGL